MCHLHPPYPGSDFAALNLFHTAWFDAGELSTDADRKQGQAVAVFSSSWLRHNAHRQGSGPRVGRVEQANLVVDVIVLRILRGKLYTPNSQRFAAFWTRIVHNELISSYRRAARQQRLLRNLAVLAERQQERLPREVDFPLLSQFGDLTLRQKAIIELIYVARMSRRDATDAIVTRFGVSRRTVDRDLEQIRSQLKAPGGVVKFC